MGAEVIHGESLGVVRGMEDSSFDAVITDPPYELGFMGKKWDASGIAYSVEFWREVLRVLKRGGRLLAFGGTRTSHRMVCAIEDAGFIVEDTVMWIYGSGFPKHKSKLKPAHEPVTIARKGYSSHLNIDACRIEGADGEGHWHNARSPNTVLGEASGGSSARTGGRWPANVILDDEAGRMLDEQTAHLHATGNRGGTVRSGPGRHGIYGRFGDDTAMPSGYPDSGGASRFFYCAKASRAERNAGLEGMPEVERRTQGRDVVRVIDRKDGRGPVPVNAQIRPAANHHPTVKPVSLMRYLCRLVTPPGGLVLDPFCGSGTTGVACVNEGFGFVGVEREAEYAEIARRRILAAQNKLPLFT